MQFRLRTNNRLHHYTIQSALKTLQLTGIGNALVDIEYRVTDDELRSFGVDKGAMTLTEPERRAEILAQLSDREAHKSSGGSAANSIIAFSQFGGSAAYCSILGHDSDGEHYASEFRDLGIHLEAPLVSGLETGTCVVFVSPDAERTLNTTLAANLAFSRRHINEELIKRSEWVYIEGYKLTDDNGAEAADMVAFYAKKHDTRLAVSCSDGFIVDVFGDRLRDILRHADLVFGNEREAASLAGEATPHEAFRALASRYPNVVVTMGDKGSLVRWCGIEAEIPAYQADLVDTIGAGDMYAGAFLYGVLHRHHPEYAGRLASYASAQVVAQYGPRLKASHIEVRDSILSTSPQV